MADLDAEATRRIRRRRCYKERCLGSAGLIPSAAGRVGLGPLVVIGPSILMHN